MNPGDTPPSGFEPVPRQGWPWARILLALVIGGAIGRGVAAAHGATTTGAFVLGAVCAIAAAGIALALAETG